jgi:hypothetical protein
VAEAKGRREDVESFPAFAKASAVSVGVMMRLKSVLSKFIIHSLASSLPAKRVERAILRDLEVTFIQPQSPGVLTG